MLRSINKFLCLLLALAGVQRAAAFSLLGPFETWQTPEVGFGFGELGGSRNIGDEYRINTPVVTYGFDASFLDYFGSEGVKAVDQAVALFNKLPRVSKTSLELNEFLTDDAKRNRSTAEALNLLDLKSTTMGILMEHVGLAGEEHVFDLRQRIPLPGACQFDYTVIMRNFDPTSVNQANPPQSRFVNGTPYTYAIIDDCPVRSVAFAEEFIEQIDPTSFLFTAVASSKIGLNYGDYYINITRDDMGGLRYLYRLGNRNQGEHLPPDAVARPYAGPWQPVDFFQTNNVVTNTAATRGGIEKIRFQKTAYNPVFGTTFKPFVQSYTVPTLSPVNGLFSQSVRRPVLQPDILFTAGDIGPSSPSARSPIPTYSRSITFVTNEVNFSSNNGGPGIILPQQLITFNKVGPFFFNQTDAFLNEVTATKGYLWASFDGSTNDPIIYPQGTSIREIERRVLTGNP